MSGRFEIEMRKTGRQFLKIIISRAWLSLAVVMFCLLPLTAWANFFPSTTDQKELHEKRENRRLIQRTYNQIANKKDAPAKFGLLVI